jgi:uncharacterized protein (TIGR03067 family)
MRKFVLALPVVFLLLAAEEGKKDTKGELKKFEGTWVPVSVEINGNKVPDETVKEIQLTFKGNSVTRKIKDKTAKATFKVDPSKDPKWFDGKGEVEEKEVYVKGVYKFEDGRLTICVARGSSKELKRPKKFSTEGGTQEAPLILVVLKKAKGE